MIKRIKLFAVLFTWTYANILFGQCALGAQYQPFDASSLNVGNRTEIICCMWANEYMVINNLVAGNTYTFDSCGAILDTELTLFDPNDLPVAFDISGCSGSDDGLISGFVPAVSGTYKLQMNSSGCGFGSVNTQIYVTLDMVLGLDDDREIIAMLYPNPTTDEVSIETNQPIDKVSVYNVKGQLVVTFNGHLKSYSIRDLNRGLYFLTIHSNNGSTTQKLIKY
ncbi:MAG: T9SS type A sorting domain-containing protein [Bacteroidota bacterium]